MTDNNRNYYLIREDLLSESVLKTVQAKELLGRGEVKSINEAVERVGLSRSAFYKYKDGVYTLSMLERERIVTIGMDLDHRSGILSKVLALVAEHGGNVLTINQTIPLQGMANVTISVDASAMGARMDEMMGVLTVQEGVRRAAILGQGGSF